MTITQRPWTEAYFAVTWLRISEMNSTPVSHGNSYFTCSRLLWSGLLALISAVLTQSGAAQSPPAASADSISIDYGIVTQLYGTTWSDPMLPAGVPRGMPPSVLSRLSENGDQSSLPAEAANDAISTGIANDTSEAAVLYAIDLGEEGMTMMVSAKTSMLPGDCVAIERSGAYYNLRGVNLGFCDPSTHATIARLRSINLAAAQRCQAAREQLEMIALEENQTPTPSEIGMLCDGS